MRVGDLDRLDDRTPRGLVLAHFRHRHTDYDQQLKQLDFMKNLVLEEIENETARIVRELRVKKRLVERRFEELRLKIREEYNRRALKLFTGGELEKQTQGS